MLSQLALGARKGLILKVEAGPQIKENTKSWPGL